MLKVNPNPTFWTKVQISVADQERPATIQVEFLRIRQADVDAYVADIKGMSSEDGDARTERTRSFIVPLIKDWRGLDTEFSPQALEDLFANYPVAMAEFVMAYRKAFLESRVKN